MLTPLSASKLYVKSPYPTAARLAFGFVSFVAVLVAILAGIAINSRCAGVAWTRHLWLQNLETIPQQLGILWFMWLPLGIVVAVIFAALTKGLRQSTLLTTIGIATIIALVAATVAFLGTGGCWVPNF